MSFEGGLRKRKRPYTNVPSKTIKDTRLSPKALGILVIILDKPDGWVVRADAIARERGVGRDYIGSGLKELSEAGYYRKELRRLRDGTFKSGNAISEESVPSWVRDYEEYDGKSVPLIQQKDGSFRVKLKDGSLDSDGFEQVAPVTGKPEPDNPEPVNDRAPVTGKPNSVKPVTGSSEFGEPGALSTTEESLQRTTTVEERTAGSSSTVANAPYEDSPARDQAKREDHPQRENEAQLALGEEPDKPGAEVAVPDKSGPQAEARQLARDWLAYLDEQGTPPVKRKNGSPFFALATPFENAIKAGYTPDEIRGAMLALYETRTETVPSAELLTKALAQLRKRTALVAGATPEAKAAANEILNQFAEFNGGVVLNGQRARAEGQIVDALVNGATPQQVALALQMCGEPAPPGWKFQRALFGKLPGASARQDDRDAVFVLMEAEAAAYDARHGGASEPADTTTGGTS